PGQLWKAACKLQLRPITYSGKSSPLSNETAFAAHSRPFESSDLADRVRLIASSVNRLFWAVMVQFESEEEIFISSSLVVRRSETAIYPRCNCEQKNITRDRRQQQNAGQPKRFHKRSALLGFCGVWDIDAMFIWNE